MKGKSGKRKILLWIGLALFPVVAAAVCLFIGRLSISPKEALETVWNAITGSKETNVVFSTILRLRLPRILTALAVGAGLSIAGASFQSLFVNPLATPDTVGVASGASFGAALGILLHMGTAGTQALSFLSGIAAVTLTVLAGTGKKRNLNSVVLSGIMIGSLFSALVSLVKFTADSESELPAITYFLLGSFASPSYEKLLIGLVPITVGIVTLFLLRWRMNLLLYSEEEARSFGVNLRALRIVVLASATLVTSSCIAMCGQVGWIGLLVPHMCRMAFRNDHRPLLPASLLLGSGFMVIVDTLARSVSRSEIPVSVLTALVGAPFFIYLMRKKGGWTL
ncbi:MAG: iron ABC transporter permease [Lachnospiraceae bacterium]|nr:iron ABC transporter permease [Lachnospiraceae bacterium]